MRGFTMHSIKFWQKRQARLRRTCPHIMVIVALLALPVVAAAQTEVRVGGYKFPPFVDDSAPQGGVTPALIGALNSLDSAVTFTFVETAPARRYRDFQAGKFDVMLLEMEAWGWRDRDVDITMTRAFLKGGEVYVARAEDAQSAAYFDDFADKRIAAIFGYHYGFADFNSDPAYLRENFRIELGRSHRGNLRKLLRGRADIAVVTESFLKLYLKENPDAEAELRISEKRDQTYRLGALVGLNAPIDAARLEKLFARLEAKGVISQTLALFGIADQWIPTDSGS